MIERHYYGVWDAEKGWVNFGSSICYKASYNLTFDMVSNLTESYDQAQRWCSVNTIIRRFDLTEKP